jgi:hypothetical protein
MKKLFSIVILSAYLFLLGGYIVTWQLLMHGNRTYIAQQVRNGNLSRKIISINLSKKTAGNIIDGDEFDWQNKRYDIDKIIDHGDHITVYAVNDEKEEILVSALNNFEYFGEKHPSDSNGPSNLLNDFFKEYNAENRLLIQSASFFYLSPAQNPFYCHHVLAGYTDILAPPPKAEI